MEFRLDMTTIYRCAHGLVLLVTALALTACLPGESEDEGPGDVAIEFTNPAAAEVIQTPDIVVNISGTARAHTELERVSWTNDRGGKGAANGLERWTTGNIVLQLGTNNITVTAEDVEGNTISKSLTVERENTSATTLPTADTDPELMYSYSSNLANAAPVDGATINRGTVWLFVRPGADWLDRGLSSITIMCCKGQDGPGSGEPYGDTETTTTPTWSAAFDTSGFQEGGTRRVRVTANFIDGTDSGGTVVDFTIGASGGGGNTAPMISGVPEPTGTVGTQYSFRPTAQDPDGDTMTFSIANKPSWATFSNSTGRLFGTPAASDVGRYDNIIISVSDGQHSSSLRAFSIDVAAFGDGSATLTWTIPTERTDKSTLNNLKGFHVYYGQSSGDYANKITLNNSSLSSHIVDNLSSGRWYFIVTAFDADGIESNPSNEGSKLF